MLHLPSRRPVTRREALCRMGGGFGMLSFASLVSESLARADATADSNGVPGARIPNFKPKAKHVIFLFMNGGLSQVDSFDPKPMLDKYNGQPLPGEVPQHERKTGNLMRSPFAFKKYGNSGTEVSEIFPYLGECVDDMCVIRSMYTDIPNHEPSLLMMNVGHIQPGRPSMGSWITYGLGTENRNLPGFVVLCPEVPTTVGPPLWNSAFLPPVHQGTFISDNVKDKKFDPHKLIPDIRNDKFDLTQQKSEIDLLARLDQLQIEQERADDPQLNATLESMETAYRMQTEAPDVFDVRKESQATLDMYGPGAVARGCLTAVRLAEKGVRMTQVYYSQGDPWDAHGDIFAHKINAKNSDQGFAAVVKDLKARGMWKDTLVVCGSEFGRTPVREVGGGGAALKRGRDHNPFGFTMWLAGGAVKGGTIYGATDEFGFKAVEKPVHVHDIHATILYLFGIDHTKLTYRYSGRDFRLTDVSGNVLHELIA